MCPFSVNEPTTCTFSPPYSYEAKRLFAPTFKSFSWMSVKRVIPSYGPRSCSLRSFVVIKLLGFSFFLFGFFFFVIVVFVVAGTTATGCSKLSSSSSSSSSSSTTLFLSLLFVATRVLFSVTGNAASSSLLLVVVLLLLSSSSALAITVGVVGVFVFCAREISIFNCRFFQKYSYTSKVFFF